MKIPVLQNINLQFSSGELTGIAGLNGCGKSTLLKSMCALLPIIGGDIHFNGISVNDIPVKELAKLISVVLTERAGGFNLTVEDIVAMGQMPYTGAFHILNLGHRRVIEETMALCKIKPLAHKAIHELSDGQFQKTMIARALAQQTPAILLDEPSAFLDYASRHELFALLRQLTTQQNKCVVVSSHDLDLLVKYCSRLVIIDDGKAISLSINEAIHHAAFKNLSQGYL